MKASFKSSHDSVPTDTRSISGWFRKRSAPKTSFSANSVVICRHANGRNREGFRMPARRERLTQYRGPASESLRRTNAQESGERLAVYGDLTGRAGLDGGTAPKTPCSAAEEPMVRRLSPGGSRIRTIGPA